jgi:hypothetical protein
MARLLGGAFRALLGGALRAPHTGIVTLSCSPRMAESRGALRATSARPRLARDEECRTRTSGKSFVHHSAGHMYRGNSRRRARSFQRRPGLLGSRHASPIRNSAVASCRRSEQPSAANAGVQVSAAGSRAFRGSKPPPRGREASPDSTGSARRAAAHSSMRGGGGSWNRPPPRKLRGRRLSARNRPFSWQFLWLSTPPHPRAGPLCIRSAAGAAADSVRESSPNEETSPDCSGPAVEPRRRTTCHRGKGSLS